MFEDAKKQLRVIVIALVGLGLLIGLVIAANFLETKPPEIIVEVSPSPYAVVSEVAVPVIGGAGQSGSVPGGQPASRGGGQVQTGPGNVAPPPPPPEPGPVQRAINFVGGLIP